MASGTHYFLCSILIFGEGFFVSMRFHGRFISSQYIRLCPPSAIRVLCAAEGSVRGAVRDSGKVTHLLSSVSRLR